MPPIVSLTAFGGTDSREHPRFLTAGIGVSSTNQKPESSDLVPWRNPRTVAGPVIPSGRQTIYRYGQTQSDTLNWMSWAGQVHVVTGFDPSDTTQRIYYTGDGTPKWTDNTIALASAPYPTTARELGLPRPIVAPTATMVTDGATGEPRRLYYVYVWVTAIGWETAPSPPTLAPLAKPGAVLNLVPNEAPPSGTHNIDRIRWYRTQVADDGSASFFFLREYPVGTAGQQDDGRAVGNSILPTAAATIRLPIPADAKYLTYCWNQFAAVISGNEICFCETNLIYAYPDGNRYTVPKPFAQVAFSGRLLVFTERGFEVFVGTSPDRMDQKPMEGAVLVSPRSIVSGDNFCMWAAADGLWIYSGSGPRCLTSECMTQTQWKALNPATIHGYLLVQNERAFYMGFYNDGLTMRGFVVDPTNKYGFHALSTGYGAAFWDRLQRKLFVLDGSTLKQWDDDTTFMTATFVGPVARQLEDVEAERIEVLGDAVVKMRVDDVEVYNHTLDTGEHRTHDGTQGRDWQLEVSTATSLQGVVVE